LSKFKVGDSVNLTINRDGKTVHIKATLANLPQ